MAGHSHSANIKHRKDRQDNARSRLFLKLRNQIEKMIKEAGCINEKILLLANKNKFPKEKVIHIYEEIKKKTKAELFDNDQFFFFITSFDLLVCVNNKNNLNFEKTKKELGEKFDIKAFLTKAVSRYFSLKQILEFEVEEKKKDLLEVALLETFSDRINYKIKENLFRVLLSDKSIISECESLIKKDLPDTKIYRDIFWEPFSFIDLSFKDKLEYIRLKKFLEEKELVFNTNYINEK